MSPDAKVNIFNPGTSKKYAHTKTDSQNELVSLNVADQYKTPRTSVKNGHRAEVPSHLPTPTLSSKRKRNPVDDWDDHSRDQKSSKKHQPNTVKAEYMTQWRNTHPAQQKYRERLEQVKRILRKWHDTSFRVYSTPLKHDAEFNQDAKAWSIFKFEDNILEARKNGDAAFLKGVADVWKMVLGDTDGSLSGLNCSSPVPIAPIPSPIVNSIESYKPFTTAYFNPEDTYYPSGCPIDPLKLLDPTLEMEREKWWSRGKELQDLQDSRRKTLAREGAKKAKSIQKAKKNGKDRKSDSVLAKKHLSLQKSDRGTAKNKGNMKTSKKPDSASSNWGNDFSLNSVVLPTVDINDFCSITPHITPPSTPRDLQFFPNQPADVIMNPIVSMDSSQANSLSVMDFPVDLGLFHNSLYPDNLDCFAASPIPISTGSDVLPTTYSNVLPNQQFGCPQLQYDHSDILAASQITEASDANSSSTCGIGNLDNLQILDFLDSRALSQTEFNHINVSYPAVPGFPIPQESIMVPPTPATSPDATPDTSPLCHNLRKTSLNDPQKNDELIMALKNLTQPQNQSQTHDLNTPSPSHFQLQFPFTDTNSTHSLQSFDSAKSSSPSSLQESSLMNQSQLSSSPNGGFELYQQVDIFDIKTFFPELSQS